ncbi:hypothetical protein INF35_12300 [Subdoligranulum sp. DSM 109015]|uniref:Uncharacterized protein n=1 Tax=Gemmiger gallinarum TaxID=2779354 RepID=A0ABR9R5Y3_9FIRM|nr:hypothetical protein [Gemmiger gallinarum]MBE5038570.1 hypothetical protein [Gemmiger gallinarum]
MAKKEALHPENGKAGPKAVAIAKKKDNASRKCCRSIVRISCMACPSALVTGALPDSL